MVVGEMSGKSVVSVDVRIQFETDATTPPPSVQDVVAAMGTIHPHSLGTYRKIKVLKILVEEKEEPTE